MLEDGLSLHVHVSRYRTMVGVHQCSSPQKLIAHIFVMEVVLVGALPLGISMHTALAAGSRDCTSQAAHVNSLSSTPAVAASSYCSGNHEREIAIFSVGPVVII